MMQDADSSRHNTNILDVLSQQITVYFEIYENFLSYLYIFWINNEKVEYFGVAM